MDSAATSCGRPEDTFVRQCESLHVLIASLLILLQEDCSSYMFSYVSTMAGNLMSSLLCSRHMTRGWTPSAPRHVTYATYGSERDVEFHLPEVAEAWMPRMLMDTTRYLRKQYIDELFFQSREGDNCRMLLESRLMAKRELDAVGWEKGDDDDIVRNSKDKEGAKLLESVRRTPFHQWALPTQLPPRRYTTIATGATQLHMM